MQLIVKASPDPSLVTGNRLRSREVEHEDVCFEVKGFTLLLERTA